MSIIKDPERRRSMQQTANSGTSGRMVSGVNSDTESEKGAAICRKCANAFVQYQQLWKCGHHIVLLRSVATVTLHHHC